MLFFPSISYGVLIFGMVMGLASWEETVLPKLGNFHNTNSTVNIPFICKTANLKLYLQPPALSLTPHTSISPTLNHPRDGYQNTRDDHCSLESKAIIQPVQFEAIFMPCLIFPITNIIIKVLVMVFLLLLPHNQTWHFFVWIRITWHALSSWEL